MLECHSAVATCGHHKTSAAKVHPVLHAAHDRDRGLDRGVMRDLPQDPEFGEQRLQLLTVDRRAEHALDHGLSIRGIAQLIAQLGAQQALHFGDRHDLRDAPGEVELQGHGALGARAQGGHRNGGALAGFRVRKDQADARKQESWNVGIVVIGPADSRKGVLAKVAQPVGRHARFDLVRDQNRRNAAPCPGLRRDAGEGRAGARQGGRRRRGAEHRNDRLGLKLVGVLHVVWQVGERCLQHGVIASTVSHSDPGAQGLAILALQHGRRAQEKATHTRHLTLFQRGAHKVRPDIAWPGIFRQRNGRKARVHRLARRDNGLRRGLERRPLVAIGLRNQMRRHERRRAQRPVENKGCISCKWNPALATMLHRAASVIKPRIVRNMVSGIPLTLPSENFLCR